MYQYVQYWTLKTWEEIIDKETKPNKENRHDGEFVKWLEVEYSPDIEVFNRIIYQAR